MIKKLVLLIGIAWAGTTFADEIYGQIKRVQVGDYSNSGHYFIMMADNQKYSLGPVDDAAAKARYTSALSALSTGSTISLVYSGTDHSYNQILFMVVNAP